MAPKQRPPPPSDLDVYRSAHLWVQRHGDAATSKAREMVEAMRKEGDEDGVDVWLRIIVAIGALAELRRRVWSRSRVKGPGSNEHSQPQQHIHLTSCCR